MTNGCRIAYFSMEIGLQPDIPTYAGGLGVLAGDTVRAAADLQVPMVAVTLLHRQGYFFQRFDPSGWQVEEPVRWAIDDLLQRSERIIPVVIEGRQVKIRVWKFDVVGVSGFIVPVYLLDTDVEENDEQDRKITNWLYGGDDFYRLCQEVVLGIGGVRVLRAHGHNLIERFHMNEGHAALLTIELLREQRERAGGKMLELSDMEAVRQRCVFTTHTPVSAGHDQFSLDLVDRVLGSREACELHDPVCHNGRLNMTYLGLTMSRYVNGVAKMHGETTQHMFAEYKIDSITNGVHAATWTSDAFARLFDHHIPGWRSDSSSLRSAVAISCTEVWGSHRQSKMELMEVINRDTNAGFDVDHFTIGFARRATGYKRPDLIFEDVQRLREIVKRCGPIQIVFAGKAHPKDDLGKRLIQNIIRQAEQLKGHIAVSYLPNYDMRLAKSLVAGSDLWLNTPQPPLEASGTSGMKAALNGVPSLSVLDGWWIEGCIEGVTGWAIDDGQAYLRSQVACSLYDKLEQTIIPMYYNDRGRFIDVMRHTIALNGSFFNTHRMIQQYAQKAYL
ncbi:MAG: alpha-glucan family phosphorylase [Pirellulaceae bacterium]|nr:alpha-glucan family phosphorylase [Pirellulaceae bacterium]